MGMDGLSRQMKTLSGKWVRYRSIAYLRGRGLIYGCGPDTPLPRAAKDEGKYAINCDWRRHEMIDCVQQSLDIFDSSVMDFVFLGPGWATIPHRQQILQEAITKLKVGGHLVLHTEDKYIPTEGLQGAWQAKDEYLHRDGQSLSILKKLPNKDTFILPAKPRATKRACVCRYGAIGDMIILTPLIRALHEDGYEVTMNVTPYGKDVLNHNPFISNMIVQEREAIPNNELGEYWDEWRGDYEKYINLSESIEGSMLKVEGREEFYAPKAIRNTPVNYYDKTLTIGGYPDIRGKIGELYFSREEQKDAQHLRKRYNDSFLVMWALNGSSHHKQYPRMREMLEQWMPSHPRAKVVLVGDANAKAAQFEHPQIIPMAGEVALRRVLALIQYMNVVVGPETAITNAAGCYDDVHKIVLLSHSSPSNLTMYWKNCMALAPSCACHPCHQLHYSKESCPLVQITDMEDKPLLVVPLCTIAIEPSTISQQLSNLYTNWEANAVV